MTIDLDLLHDPGLLRNADRAGLLPAAATVGAQVRSLIDQLAALPAPERPRSMVIAGSQIEAEVAMVAALAGPAAIAPVVGVTEIPSWLGPLDLVVVLSDRRADPVALSAAETAARRGATVVLRADELSGVPGPGVLLMPPQLAVSEALAAATRIALVCAVARWAGVISGSGSGPIEWADELDAMAMACHPSTESFVNPAMTLAEHLSSGQVLIVGGDPVGDAVAMIAARLLAELAALPASVLGHGAAELTPAVLRAAATPRDIFADDDDAETIRLTLVLGPAPPGRAAPLTGALPGAFVVAPDEAEHPAGTGTRPDAPREPDALRPPLAQIARWTFAALYLGLGRTDQPVPIDHPDGLGRNGTALGAVRTDEQWAGRSRGRGADPFGDQRGSSRWPDGADRDDHFRDNLFRDGADRDGADRDGANRDGADRDGADRDDPFRDDDLRLGFDL